MHTIGLAKLPLPHLLTVMDLTSSQRLIDLRARPDTRAGLSRTVLSIALGDRYLSIPELGGQRYFATLAAAHASWGANAHLLRAGDLLACQCGAPGDCHRLDICSLHAPTARHIYEDHWVSHTELVRAIAEGDDYDCTNLNG